MRRLLLFAFAVLALVVAAAAVAVGSRGDDRESYDPPQPAAENGRAASFAVERLASGFNRPTFVGTAPGDPDALWVLEQPGRVVRLEGDDRRTVLDLSDQVRTGAEQGLLGIAFHPDFAHDPRLYLHWSDRAGDTRLAEFRFAGDAIDPAPVRELLHVEQPEENHNGGQLAFGPDGRLYVGLGDGGGAFDPDERAQDPDDRLGKLLSVDVEAAPARLARRAHRPTQPVAVLVRPGARRGLDRRRRSGRDRGGQPRPARADEPPKNLGWDAFEGTAKTEEDDFALDTAGELVWPVATYTHDDGCSVTGGYVYQGTRLPRLRGRYVYGDFCSGVAVVAEGRPAGQGGGGPARARRRAAAHAHRARRRRRAAVRVRERLRIPRS